MGTDGDKTRVLRLVKARMPRTAIIAIAFMAVAPVASLHVAASSHAAVAALDLVSPAVVTKDTVACQSPWQVFGGRDCLALPKGTEVNIVSGDDFFACVVWPGTQRCMWVARDVLRRP
jgi:hypothetical protein